MQPEMTDPIIAYRGWDTRANATLHAVGYDDSIWSIRKPMVASCDNGHDEAVNPPGSDCSCGIYAFKDLTALHQVVHEADVLGRVALWGRIVEHESGYRAEYAYPQVLFYGAYSADEDKARKAAALYGCDVMPVPDDLVTFMEERERKEAEERAKRPRTPYQSMYDMMVSNVYGMSPTYSFNYQPWTFSLEPQRPFTVSESLKEMGFNTATAEEVERYGRHR